MGWLWGRLERDEMLEIVAGMALGTSVGIVLPWVLLAARNLCIRSGISKRITALFSHLSAYTVAFCGGGLTAIISGRLEVLIAGGAVFAGLLIVMVAYRNRRTEPERTIQTYARGYGIYYMIIAMVGGELVAR